VEYGLRPVDALLAATKHAAENLGISHLVGTIEVGKAGDVVIVDGDPMADVKALDAVRLVAKDGRLFRNDLL
jgi:imidazolonepropionase-like amidohydrolase